MFVRPHIIPPHTEMFDFFTRFGSLELWNFYCALLGIVRLFLGNFKESKFLNLCQSVGNWTLNECQSEILTGFVASNGSLLNKRFFKVAVGIEWG